VIQLFAGVHGAQTCVLLEPDFIDHQLCTALVDDHGLVSGEEQARLEKNQGSQSRPSTSIHQ
jgi:hypothetical protein